MNPSDSLLDLTEDERGELLARARLDPAAQQDVARRMRAAIADQHREVPPGVRGGLDRLLDRVAADQPTESAVARTIAAHRAGSLSRAAVLGDPDVRAALGAALAARDPRSR